MKPRQFITQVAAEFPDAPDIEYFGSDEFGLYWENDRCVAGLTVGPEAAFVYLEHAQVVVAEPEIAIRNLKAIFAGKVVAVMGSVKGLLAHATFARPDDISGAFTDTSSLSAIGFPAIDNVWIRSWGGEHEHGSPPEIDGYLEEIPDEPALDVWGRPIREGP